jgi:hypothetical protein
VEVDLLKADVFNRDALSIAVALFFAFYKQKHNKNVKKLGDCI